MYLEKLEINGFKSFARKVELEFKPGITAIVGPNGSGKSNVADAVRWVLGEQSIKLLRGKKSEDVIFSGSDKKARLGMAETSLHLNNDPVKSPHSDHGVKPGGGNAALRGAGKNDIEMSEICITRKLYRNGESEYLINKQKSRLADIQMLMAKVGMAHASYSIIGQGMIDAFLLASSSERKEFFEEASGVKPLQIKRGQALNKLERTEENLEIAQIQLQEITPRLNSLTRQVKKLERRAEIELKLKDAQQKYYGAVWHELNKEWKTKHEEIKKIAVEQDKIQEQVNELQNQMARLTKDSAKSEEFEKLQKEYQDLLEKKMRLNEELSGLKIKMVQQTQKSVKQKNIPYALSQELINALNILNKLKDKIGSALQDKDYQQVEKHFQEQVEILNRLGNLLAPFEAKDQESAHQSGQNQGSQDEIKGIQEKIEKVSQQVKQVQSAIKKEGQKEKEERSQIWEIQKKYQAQQQKLNEISDQVNNLRIELARLETKKDDLEQEIRQEMNESGLEQIKQLPVNLISGDEKREKVTEIVKLKRQLELIGGIDPEVQSEYEEIKERHGFLSSQTQDLKKSIQSLEKLILDLDETIKKQFESSFKVINEEFQKYFKTLFAGGRSKLVLVKEEHTDKHTDKHTDETLSVEANDFTSKAADIADADGADKGGEEAEEDESEVERIKDRLKSTTYAGVEIEATPPGKKLKSINMLSGGERALTSIALLCAIISANPSPFVFLDEVDAALDEANSIRFAEILEELAHKSQFIIVTHNRATMEKSDILYGVTMGDDGVSALLSLKLERAEKYTNR